MKKSHKLVDKYNPKEFEEKLYKEWEEKGNFKPSMNKEKESYCIMMPPPNVTGKLHMGHALDDTLQDILIRTKRMQGYNTLWLPRTDQYVEVATTRPETILGDMAVAVHPDDERYTELVGKTCIVPIVNREIPIIADRFIEKEFGTGCVNVTPFGTKILKHLKLKRFVELITNYFNENRRELVVC